MRKPARPQQADVCTGAAAGDGVGRHRESRSARPRYRARAFAQNPRRFTVRFHQTLAAATATQIPRPPSPASSNPAGCAAAAPTPAAAAIFAIPGEPGHLVLWAHRNSTTTAVYLGAANTL